MIVYSPTIRGSGAISRAFTSPDGSMLAIASTLPFLTNPPGRATYMGQRIHQRLALHHRGEASPFAVFDHLRLPINEVSFHPFDPVIAVAAGSYDGGYMFEGELFLWDWQADRSWLAVKSVPEVERCSFSEDGKRLDILVRPWNEEWGEGDDPFDRVYPLSLPYRQPGRAEMADVVIDPGQAIVRHTLEFATPDPNGHETTGKQLSEWFGVDELSSRGAIWDVAWLDDARIAAVHNDCLLEIHDLASGGVISFKEDGRYGADILRTSPPVIAVYDVSGWQIQRSRLLALLNDSLSEIITFEGCYNFASSKSGLVLGRLDRHRAGEAKADVIVDLETSDARFADLGHYDCFNHFLGIDAAPDLFILQGRPETSHENKRLCRVHPDGAVEPLWPVLRADGSHASHAMECLGCYVEDELGPGIIMTGRHYDPDPNKGKRGFIFRKPIPSGDAAGGSLRSRWLRHATADQEIWRFATTAGASAIAHARKEGLILVAFLDGTLSLLSAADGVVVITGQVTIEGLPTVIYCMDVVDGSLAVGTFDGRIAVIPFDQLRNCESIGRIELA
ncbi:hypothetical protein [Rhizobium sp. P28RR-XV]|uniref:hypothetical protein n=1 Tax=Rhizobium sp. P28RR-XV TaxID=2726737 RepID=UPI0014573E7E|nr:hypothetical protein [Rhizobium sp. P28RR-XV]NLR86169.1 hypothetical protein [Rhizobium sp. P28RR-XV]